MISIAPCDRDALRFLWFDDVTRDNPTEVVYRFCRLVFGITPSPFLLNATIEQHLSRYARKDSELARKLLKSLYVDDLSGGEATVGKAFDTFLKSKKMMADGGFNLRKWSTNSNELRQKIQVSENRNVNAQLDPNTEPGVVEEDTTYTKSTLGNEGLPNESGERKVLGKSWNFHADSLVFRLDHLA